MDKKLVEKFKMKLLKIKEQIVNGQLVNDHNDLRVRSEDLSEQGDIANNIISQTVSFKLRERELRKLASINEALERIKYGEYGHCEDCGDEISIKRLENQPWSELCIEHAEERERESAVAFKKQA